MTKKAEASKFEASGKPTVQQVRAVWDAMPHPSYRKVADELTKRGFKINFKTVSRYMSRDYVQQRVAGKAMTDGEAMANAKVVDQIVQEKNPTPPPTAEELASNFLKRLTELGTASEADLMMEEARKRRILNIILMEEAIGMARVLLLAPGDTARLILSFAASTAAQMAMKTAEAMEREARGTENGKVIDHVPLTPLQQSIEMFKKKDKVA